jgi:hypothetical protein
MKFIGKSLPYSLGIGFAAGYNPDGRGFAFQFHCYLLISNLVLKHERSKLMH